jgi:hypothetical protein
MDGENCSLSNLTVMEKYVTAGLKKSVKELNLNEHNLYAKKYLLYKELEMQMINNGRKAQDQNGQFSPG